MMREELDEALHGCPACGELVARRKRTCADCWSEVPGRLRLKLTVAYLRRMKDPTAYQEALADLLLWCRDRIVRREVAVSSWGDMEPLIRPADGWGEARAVEA